MPKYVTERTSLVYKDDDGWWCIFRDGWSLDGCTGGWREDTKARLFREIKRAKFNLTNP